MATTSSWSCSGRVPRTRETARSRSTRRSTRPSRATRSRVASTTRPRPTATPTATRWKAASRSRTSTARVLLSSVLDVLPPQPTFTTERLVLRPLRDDDTQAVASGAGDRRVARYLIQVPSPYPIALARQWVHHRHAWWELGRGITL